MLYVRFTVWRPRRAPPLFLGQGPEIGQHIYRRLHVENAQVRPFPGPVALDELDEGALAGTRAIFPSALDESVDTRPVARSVPRGFEVRALVDAPFVPAATLAARGA